MSHSNKDNGFVEKNSFGLKSKGPRKGPTGKGRRELERELRAAKPHAERHLENEKLRQLLKMRSEAWDAFEED